MICQVRSNRRWLSRFRCGCHGLEKKRKRKEKTTPFGVNLMRSQVVYRAAQCHGLHVDTGRWVGIDRKDRLCQVCHSLQDVEDKQQFIFDCLAYSHLRTKHASPFQQVCTVSDFWPSVNQMHVEGLLQTVFLTGDAYYLIEWT